MPNKKTLGDRITWVLSAIGGALSADLASSHINPVKRYQQFNSWSCTANVLQMVVHYVSYGEMELTRKEAIDFMDCEPDGASLYQIAAIAEQLIPSMEFEEIDTPKTREDETCLRAALFANAIVIACDPVSHMYEHAVLVVGMNKDGWWIVDPLLSLFPIWYPKEMVTFLTDLIVVRRGEL